MKDGSVKEDKQTTNTNYISTRREIEVKYLCACKTEREKLEERPVEDVEVMFQQSRRSKFNRPQESKLISHSFTPDTIYGRNNLHLPFM